MIDKSNNLKLNLGCGNKKLEGYLNIDYSEHCSPDFLMDLENVPFPFRSNTVIEIRMKSVLEHLSHDPKKFFPILQEIYRISQDQALIYIECPHPSHRWQVVDFTHQKPIHLEGLQMLDKSFCKKLIAANSTKSPLALMFDVDFRIVDYKCTIDPKCATHIKNILGTFDPEKIESYTYLFTNVAATQKITLRVVK